MTRDYRIDWQPEEIAWVRETVDWYPTRKAQHAAFQRRWGRPEVAFSAFASMCKRIGAMTGRDCRFVKGQVSHNKGKKGFCPPGSEKGWFQPGTRNGRAAALHRPIGTERISRGGYLERKVNEELPFKRRWRAVHRIEWEALHGPLPDSHCLKCLDGNKLNTDPSNWEAIPRAILSLLNGGAHGRDLQYDQAEPETKPALMALAKLRHALAEVKG